MYAACPANLTLLSFITVTDESMRSWELWISTLRVSWKWHRLVWCMFTSGLPAGHSTLQAEGYSETSIHTAIFMLPQLAMYRYISNLRLSIVRSINVLQCWLTTRGSNPTKFPALEKYVNKIEATRSCALLQLYTHRERPSFNPFAPNDVYIHIYIYVVPHS